MRSNIESRTRILLCSAILAVVGCGTDFAPPEKGMGNEPPSGDGSGSDPSQPPPVTPPVSSTFTETVLTVMTKLTIVPGATADAPSTATIDITARDGITPVIT